MPSCVSLLLSHLKRHTCAGGRLASFRICLVFDLILFYIHRYMDLFLSSEVCVGPEHLWNYNFSLSVRRTSKSNLIPGALMSLKQTLGPFCRTCGLRKVSMCWMVLEQSLWLAFSGIYPVGTWWEKLARALLRLRPLSLPLSVRRWTQSFCLYLWNCISPGWMLSLKFLTSREVHPPPNNCSLWMLGRQTHTHTHAREANTIARRVIYVHACKDIVFFPSLFAPKTRLGWCCAPADDEEW